MADYSEFGSLELKGWSEPETAAAYARDFAAASAQCVPAFVEAVAAGPGKRAIDLCCGHGIIAAALAGTGAEVIGLDFSPAMLDMARKNAPGVEFVTGDAMNLDYADNSFDAVTIGFGIPHVPDPLRVFAECKRILRDGGRFAFSVWHGRENSLTIRTVFDAIEKHGHPDVALPPAPDAHAYAQEGVAFAALEDTGFRDCALRTVDSHWISNDPGAPFDFFLQGTVRGGTLLRGQPPEYVSKIRNAVVSDVLAECGGSPPFRIPIPAAIVSATA